MASAQAYISKLKKEALKWSKSPYSNSLYLTMQTGEGREVVRISDHAFYSHAAAEAPDREVLLVDSFGSRKSKKDIESELADLLDIYGIEQPKARAEAKTNKPQAAFSLKESEAHPSKLAFRSMLESIEGKKSKEMNEGEMLIKSLISEIRKNNPKIKKMELAQAVFASCEKVKHARRVYFLAKNI